MFRRWDGRDLEIGNFSYLDVITFSKQFQALKLAEDTQDLQTGNFQDELGDVSDLNQFIWVWF